ncbi:hypothetical protein ACFWN7_12565 [Agromyces sp. NPDC058484]|uniref:hypothetical protein n=1 Tax=Agromyces sp. NPDC058484 TaxID=3346524 RepID=UPI0036515612
MTFTHLRSFLHVAAVEPFPTLAPGLWPASARLHGRDLLVDGNSMLAQVQAMGTPCARTSAATDAAPERFASVIATRVLAVDESADGTLAAWVDAALDQVRPLLPESRLLGRRGTRAMRPVRLRPASTALPDATLPTDLRAGDLLAIPAVGGTGWADLRGRVRSAARRPDPDDPEWPVARCGR